MNTPATKNPGNPSILENPGSASPHKVLTHKIIGSMGVSQNLRQRFPGGNVSTHIVGIVGLPGLLIFQHSYSDF